MANMKDNEDAIQHLLGEIEERLTFDKKRFSLDQFADFQFVEEDTKLESEPIQINNSLPLDKGIIKVNKIEEPIPQVIPCKGILKRSQPPLSYSQRGSMYLKWSGQKIMDKWLNISSQTNLLSPDFSPTLELDASPLKKVRFAMPSPPLNRALSTRSGQLRGTPIPPGRYSPRLPPKLDLIQLTSLYLQLCHLREELPSQVMVKALQDASTSNSPIDSLDLTGEDFSEYRLLPVLDLFDGLAHLTHLELEACQLNDESIKPLVTTLLASDYVRWLSLANNPNINAEGIRIISAYISKSKRLKGLDLSNIALNSQSCGYLAKALMIPEKNDSIESPPLNSEYLQDIKLNYCSLRPQQFKILCQGVKQSNLLSWSLCGNRLSLLSAPYLAEVLSGPLETPTEKRSCSLISLDLSHNLLKSEGIHYLLLSLTTTKSSLRQLNLSNNYIDSFGAVSIFNSICNNLTLIHLDLSDNPIAIRNLDGLWSLKECLSSNRVLKELFLANIGVNDEGAVALAEILPETRTLIRLDLSNNSSLSEAGLMALSISLKLNYSITCLEVTIPPNQPNLSNMAQDMLLTCARNTQINDDLHFGP